MDLTYTALCRVTCRGCQQSFSTNFKLPPAAAGIVDGRTEEFRVEIAQLKEQRDDLQRRCAELLEKSRGLRYQVHAFHDRFGYPVRQFPALPSDGEVRFRLQLISEEFFELVEAAVGQWPAEPWHLPDIRRRMKRFLRFTTIDMDFVGFAGELHDLDYVVEGTRLYCGIEGWPLARELHRANMDKTAASLGAADSAKKELTIKPTKPKGWKPPNFEAELRLQGWQPNWRHGNTGLSADQQEQMRRFDAAIGAIEGARDTTYD